MQAQPCQFSVESFPVLFRGEITIIDSPVRDSPCDTMNNLSDGNFSFGGSEFTVKVLTYDDVGRELTP